MTTGELARILRVHVNTIRLWADEYSAYLSDTAVGQPLAKRRRLTDRDAIVLATVAQLRNDGLNHAQIVEALDGGRLLDALPAAPTPEEAAARERVGLVPVAELHRALDRVRSLQDEIEAIRSDRDRGVIALEKANADIARLERERGLIEGELNALKTERLPVRTMLQIAAVFLVGMLILVALAVVFLAGRG
jgi:DNA-binding transcriptional MerR regulator